MTSHIYQVSAGVHIPDDHWDSFWESSVFHKEGGGEIESVPIHWLEDPGAPGPESDTQLHDSPVCQAFETPLCLDPST